MPWITSDQVSVVLRTDLTADPWIDGLIVHVQGLAEVEIGEQDPPSASVQAVVANIVARMWQDGESARINPAGLTQEQTGPFAFQDQSPGTAGLGLTNREKAELRRAAGMRVISTLPTTRGDLETPAVACPTGLFPEETMSGLPW